MTTQRGTVVAILALGAALIVVSCRPDAYRTQTPDPHVDHEVGTAHKSDSDADDDGNSNAASDTPSDTKSAFETAYGVPSAQEVSPQDADIAREVDAFHDACVKLWLDRPRLTQHLEDSDRAYKNFVAEHPDPVRDNATWTNREDLRTSGILDDRLLAINTNAVVDLSGKIKVYLVDHPEAAKRLYASVPPEGHEPLFDVCFGAPVPPAAQDPLNLNRTGSGPTQTF